MTIGFHYDILHQGDSFNRSAVDMTAHDIEVYPYKDIGAWRNGWITIGIGKVKRQVRVDK